MGKGRAKLLTRRQAAFVNRYIETGNASEAYRQAGYSPRNADVHGATMLKHPLVVEALERAKADAIARVSVTAEEVLTMLRDTYRRATEAEQHGPAARAAELLGRTAALFVDRAQTQQQVSLADVILAIPDRSGSGRGGSDGGAA